MIFLMLDDAVSNDATYLQINTTETNTVARNPENEAKARATLLGALGAYQSSLLFVVLLTKEPEKKAGLQFQIRLCQFMVAQLTDETRWKELADVVWG